jgi:hypothetical protein
VALREAKTLLGVFGRRGASILVRPALCLGRPFGPAAALGSGLLMSMLFYTIRRDWKQPTTCLCVLTMSSLQQQQGPLEVGASVWRRSSARSVKRKLRNPSPSFLPILLPSRPWHSCILFQPSGITMGCLCVPDLKAQCLRVS